MIYLSLGSNLGHRKNLLEQAIFLLQENILFGIESSRILETTAILPKDAPLSWDLPYLNMIVRGNSTLSPLELLTALKNIEKNMGRDPNSLRWAPRVIDLDILLWDDLILDLPELKIPHPAINQRAFLKILLEEFSHN